MRLLLDTHVVVWGMAEPGRLSARVRQLVEKGDCEFLWSVASTWEIALKSSLGKIRLPGPLREFLPKYLSSNGISLLDVGQRHALEVAELPMHHKDPFDRLLIAQARVERVPVVSNDRHFPLYEVDVVW